MSTETLVLPNSRLVTSEKGLNSFSLKDQFITTNDVFSGNRYNIRFSNRKCLLTIDEEKQQGMGLKDLTDG